MEHYREMTCAAACNKVKGRLPYNWDLNIYRGCEHGCKYCFAMYSHEYLNSDRYFEEIYVKTNIVDRLEEHLSRPSWKRELINIGGVTDSYQPLETQLRIMPEILKLMIKYRNPCIISTKSDLILRDYDLIAELAETTYVNIAATITCMDERIRGMIEPRGVESLRRFAMLKEFTRTRANTGVHFMPIIPRITDRRVNVEALYAHAREAGVDYLLPGLLNLRGRTRRVFFEFLQQELPLLYQPLQDMYGGKSDFKEYKVRLYRMIAEIKSRYGVSGDYRRGMRERLGDAADNQQMTLF